MHLIKVSRHSSVQTGSGKICDLSDSDLGLVAGFRTADLVEFIQREAALKTTRLGQAGRKAIGTQLRSERGHKLTKLDHRRLEQWRLV